MATDQENADEEHQIVRDDFTTALGQLVQEYRKKGLSSAEIKHDIALLSQQLRG